MSLTIEDELYRKAVDQLAKLQASFEADLISAEAFKVSVETVWGVLGGVLDTPEFNDLMKAANDEIAGLNREPRIRVLTTTQEMLLIARIGDITKVGRVSRPSGIGHFRRHDTEDAAVEFVAGLEKAAQAKGFERTL